MCIEDQNFPFMFCWKIWTLKRRRAQNSRRFTNKISHLYFVHNCARLNYQIVRTRCLLIDQSFVVWNYARLYDFQFPSEPRHVGIRMTVMVLHQLNANRKEFFNHCNSWSSTIVVIIFMDRSVIWSCMHRTILIFKCWA